jgi:biotin--protein ligase
MGGVRLDSVYQMGDGQIAAAESRVFTELAKYHRDEQMSDKVAAACYNIGSGKVVVISPGVEYNPVEEPASNLQLTASQNPQSQRATEMFIRSIFAASGLHVPQNPSDVDPHPLPQFLVSSSPALVKSLTDGLGVTPTASQPTVLKDENDTFQFHAFGDGLTSLSASLQHSKDSHSWQPKHIIVCTDGNLPEYTHTPLFDLRRYFEALGRGRHTLASGKWAIGDILFYGEAVTSTQTMLDKWAMHI